MDKNNNSVSTQINRNRISIGKSINFNSSNFKENNLNICNKNKKIMELDYDIIKNIPKSNTQPLKIQNNYNNNNISSIKEIDTIQNFGLLDDFLKKLDKEETKIKKNDKKLKENKFDENAFQKENFLYFHLSRTQENM